MPTGTVAQQPTDFLVKYISKGVSSNADIIVGARVGTVRGAAVDAEEGEGQGPPGKECNKISLLLRFTRTPPSS